MKKIILLIAVFAILPGSVFATESAPLTGGAAVHDTETISTSAVTIIPANGARKFLQIQNVGSANILACTVDGTTPVVGGNGIQLLPYGSATYDVFVPSGQIKCIGSASGTVLTAISLP